jgi:hypothetical protein
MTKIAFSGILCLVLLIGMAESTRADIDAALSITDGRISSFYLAIGDHYRVPEREIIVVKKREIPDDELAVVFFVSQRAGVSPGIIVDLRLGGKTWMEITSHFSLTAEIYYVAIEKVSGPPYGKAHGYFRNRNRNEWHNIRLSDVDIINFVNLKFIATHYGYTPDEVVRMREQGQSFMAINDKIKTAKAKKTAKDKKSSDQSNSKGKGKR